MGMPGTFKTMAEIRATQAAQGKDFFTRSPMDRSFKGPYGGQYVVVCREVNTGSAYGNAKRPTAALYRFDADGNAKYIDTFDRASAWTDAVDAAKALSKVKSTRTAAARANPRAVASGVDMKQVKAILALIEGDYYHDGQALAARLAQRQVTGGDSTKETTVAAWIRHLKVLAADHGIPVSSVTAETWAAAGQKAYLNWRNWIIGAVKAKKYDAAVKAEERKAQAAKTRARKNPQGSRRR